MKDLIIKDFKVYVQEVEKARMGEFQMALDQAAMFGGNFCTTCSIRIYSTNGDMCGTCSKDAARIYKAKYNLNFLE